LSLQGDRTQTAVAGRSEGERMTPEEITLQAVKEIQAINEQSRLAEAEYYGLGPDENDALHAKIAELENQNAILAASIDYLITRFNLSDEGLSQKVIVFQGAEIDRLEARIKELEG
jgi:benzoyl-CoA reductase/2-hydroxyglutaryl-CoA dehydratase subunit BcrC/BadD/HgdB